MRYLNEIAAKGSGDLMAPVASIMRTELVTVSPDTSTKAAVMLMRDKRVGALPVVQGGHIVAMLTEEEFVGLAEKALSSLPAPARPPSPSPFSR
jgi:CBS domain-containing protein